MKDTTALRQKHLAIIHAEQRRLDLSDAAYRNLLFALTGKRSSGDMTVTQRATIIEFLRRQQPTPSAPATPVTCSDAEAASILGSWQ